MIRSKAVFRAYGEEYRRNLTLAVPVIFSNMGQVVVQLADTVMVGRLGAIPLAAVSFATSVYFMLFLFGLGLTMGLTPLVGEKYAQRDHRTAARFLQNAMVLYPVAAVVLFGIMYAVVPLMQYMGQEPEVVVQAIPYYKYMVWSMLPVMIYGIFKQFLEGVGNTRIAMYIVLSTNALNVLLNYVFIYGHWGAEAMGAAGAGLATLIARLAMPVMIVVWFLSKDWLRRYLAFFSKLDFSWRRVGELLRIGLPISTQMFLEVSAFCISSIMMGWFGAVQLAANQIATMMVNMTFMILLGVSAATTIRVSHESGRGSLPGVRRAANGAYHLTIVYNICTAVLIISLRRYLPLAFTNDPAVVEWASHLLIFGALFQISDGLQSTSLGILRGLKDVNYTMLIALIAYVLINLPIGYLCAFVLGFGPGGIWVGFIVGLSVAALLLNARFRRFCSKAAAV